MTYSSSHEDASDQDSGSATDHAGRQNLPSSTDLHGD